MKAIGKAIWSEVREGWRLLISDIAERPYQTIALFVISGSMGAAVVYIGQLITGWLGK